MFYPDASELHKSLDFKTIPSSEKLDYRARTFMASPAV
jgi:hypothetical protein